MTGGVQQLARVLGTLRDYPLPTEESEARQAAMWAPCACGRPSVFCLADIGQCHLTAIGDFTDGPPNSTMEKL